MQLCQGKTLGDGERLQKIITVLLADIVNKSNDSARILLSLRILESEDSPASVEMLQNKLLLGESLSEKDRQLYGDYYESQSSGIK